MLALYNILNGFDNIVDSVVCIGGNTEAECNTYAAENKALCFSDYANRTHKDGARAYYYRARFVKIVELEGRNRRIKISYDVVTPESAEIGDFAENGWENEEGVCIDPDELDVEEHGSVLAAVTDLAVKTIGNGVEASDYPTCHPGLTWYTEIDGETNYFDGSVRRLSYHLDGFSEDEELAIYAILTSR